MRTIRLADEARAELLHETRYYESRRAGTGAKFRRAVANAFELIIAFPQSGAPGPAGTRRSKVKGFPFTVVYREADSAMIIFAIAPDRRQPGYWLSRLPFVG